MIDVQSKGLIPQITDLLYALTDSHELLVAKLQSLRQDQRDPSPLAADESATVDAFRPAEPATHFGETIGTPEAVTTADASADDGLGRDEEHAPARPSSEAIPEGDSPHGTGTFSNVANTDRAPRAVQQPAIPAQFSATTTPTLPGNSDEGIPSRNYNFFDELDARLTHLKGS